MVMSNYVPHFRLSRQDPTQGFGLIPKVRIIPHFDKFFKWIPDSAAQRLLQVESDEILLGIDELTALVRRSNQSSWEVTGEAKVHLLKGLPHAQLSSGQRVELPLTN
jgi:cyanophycinase